MSDDNRKEPLPALPLMLKSESRSEIVQKKIIVQKESNEHENYENDGKKDHNSKGGLPLQEMTNSQKKEILLKLTSDNEALLKQIVSLNQFQFNFDYLKARI